MRKVFIKYNPYKLETEIKVDGGELKQFSPIREKIGEGTRLQVWVEELPRMLFEHFDDKNFEIEIDFHGTALDYEDILSVVDDANNQKEFKELNIRFKVEGHITAAAQEASDKEALIDDVFTEIQKGPFDELRDESIINAFKYVKSEEFRMCVVAKMSAGKSTLINALIGSKFMPSKQEACTAIITEIKDDKSRGDNFRLVAYDVNGNIVEESDKASLEYMEVFNSCPIRYKCVERERCLKPPTNPEENCKPFDKRIPYVGTVRLFGNIPFVKSDEVSLVLVDTPGPDNARDDRHKTVQSEFLDKDSQTLVLYVITGERGTEADNALLISMAKRMSIGGKQSKDRFMFVMNKLDTRGEEDGDLKETLEDEANYLSKQYKIENPNIFPAAAKPALDIRLQQRLGDKAGSDVIKRAKRAIDDFNDKESAVNLRFDEYSPLPRSIKKDIVKQLDEASKRGDSAEEAVIHTGIVSLEAAIGQYVRKYAKTAKIKNLVDTFNKKLAELDYREKLSTEIAKNQEEGEKILERINAIQEKIDSAKEAEKFEDEVDDAVDDVKEAALKAKDVIIERFHTLIRNYVDVGRGKKIDVNYVNDEIDRLKKFAKGLEPVFEVELDGVIKTNLINTGKQLLESYKTKLKSLTEEIKFSDGDSIEIDSLQLMKGNVSDSNFYYEKMIKEEEVEDGYEFIENTDKKWYKPWTWFQDDGYFRTKSKTVQYIGWDELADTFFTPIYKGLEENGKVAITHAMEQSKRIVARFKKEFRRLHDVLKQKLEDLKSCVTDKKNADKRIEESQRNLEWLEGINKKVESILEI